MSNHELNLELAAKRLSAVRKPKACNCFHGTTLATVARKHLSEPKPARRAARLTMPVTTRSDDMASLDLLASSDDTELCAYLIAGLRAFFEIV